MNTYNTSLALELERSRNKRPLVASLTAATATAPVPTVNEDLSRVERFKQVQAKSIKAKAQEKLSKLSLLNKVEFGAGTKVLFWVVILLNVIGDVLDLAILFGGVTEALSLAYDSILLPVNIVFLGMNPKNNAAAGKKQLSKVLIRFLGVENIPIISIFYLRTIYVVRLYRARKRAAEQGAPEEA